ncbi:MAG: cell division protein FtsQ/DivIB [Parachlamydiales bacterium]
MDRTLNRPQLLWVLCWTLLISGSALIALTLWQSMVERRPTDSRYQIRAIVQPQERLPADQIAALLGLENTNLYTLDLKEAEKKLLAYPLIRTAKVTPFPPDALYVDLTLRQPIARIADGWALDADGVVFPSSTDDLPTVYLGGDPKAAIPLLPIARMIDLRRQHDTRYGLREIVVETKEGDLLRLPPRHYEEALARYLRMEKGEPAIVDLRIPGAIYVQRRRG